jgi:hypothetical protein
MARFSQRIPDSQQDPKAPPQIQNTIFSKLHVFQGVQESEVSVKSKRKLLLASALGIGDKVWYPVR